MTRTLSASLIICDFLLQAVIEVIHENWPYLLDSFRMPHVHSLYPRLSEDQSREIRLSKSFMSLTEMRDGTVYFPPGGGVATSGDNLRDVMETDRVLRMLTEMQASIVQFIEDERDTADAPRHSSPVNLRLFDLGKETCSVKDESNGHVYQCRRSGSGCPSKLAYRPSCDHSISMVNIGGHKVGSHSSINLTRRLLVSLKLCGPGGVNKPIVAGGNCEIKGCALGHVGARGGRCVLRQRHRWGDSAPRAG